MATQAEIKARQDAVRARNIWLDTPNTQTMSSSSLMGWLNKPAQDKNLVDSFNQTFTPTKTTPPIPNTQNTWVQPWSVSYILGEGTVGADEQFINDYIAKQNAIYNTPIDEAAIRSQKEAEMQAQIDAINKVYADKLVQSKAAWQGRIGSNIASQARGGLLGSDFGTAQQNQIQDVNKQANDLVEQERLALVNSLLSDARNNAAKEIADKRAAVEAGWLALRDYYLWAPERKAAKTKSAAQKILALGKNPQDVSDAELKQLGISRQDLTIDFTMLQQAQEAEQAKAQAETEKAQLEWAKIQSEISLNDAKAISELLAQGKMQEVWGKIYDSQGNFVADARSVQNVVSGSFGGGVGGTTAGATGDLRGYRSQYPNEAWSGTNNPGGITVAPGFTERLRQAGIQVEWASNRPSAEGGQYYVFPTIEEGMKAYNLLWQSPSYQNLTVWQALSRWGTDSLPWVPTGKMVSQLSPEEFNNLQMAQIKKESPGLYKVMTSGGVSGLSDLAQSVQKGIITIAQIPAAQRAQVAAELSQAGQSSPKSVELQNSLSLVDTMLQDEEALKSISGWWGWRLPLTGLFSNQLAANQFDQLKGILSLWEREKLKGSGAISDFESKMLAQAASALGRNLSEKDFKAELEKVRDILSGKYKYYTEWGGNTGTITPTGNTGTGWVVNGAI